MISVVITSFKEEKTIGRAIKSILPQISKQDELIITAPDDLTLNEAKKYSRLDSRVKIFRDEGKGKSPAMNAVIPKCKGELLVFTDGDVFTGEDSINNLISPFKDSKIGAVCGRPMSVNDKNNIFGFWAYLLTEIAHTRRNRACKTGRRFFCSGYLFAIRKKLFPKLIENLLSEDGYISHQVYESGHLIHYQDKSKVYVKYPDNFKDWINQKKRSAGGYNQIKKLIGVEMRSFRKESLGVLDFLRYATNTRRAYWITLLFLSRVYLWAVIYRDINMRKKSHRDIWKRVESTK